MARATIDEDITRLEAELAAIRTQLTKTQGLRAIEEGSAQGRFRSEFADVSKLYRREAELSARLETLYNYQARSV